MSEYLTNRYKVAFCRVVQDWYNTHRHEYQAKHVSDFMTAGKYLAGGVSCWRNLEDSRSKRANNVEKTEKRLEIIDFHGERGHFRQFFQTSLEKCGAMSTKNTIWKNGGENWKNTKILQKFRICNIAVYVDR